MKLVLPNYLVMMTTSAIKGYSNIKLRHIKKYLEKQEPNRRKCRTECRKISKYQ